jgi:hypothetical protein
MVNFLTLFTLNFIEIIGSFIVNFGLGLLMAFILSKLFYGIHYDYSFEPILFLFSLVIVLATKATLKEV